MATRIARSHQRDERDPNRPLLELELTAVNGTATSLATVETVKLPGEVVVQFFQLVAAP